MQSDIEVTYEVCEPTQSEDNHLGLVLKVSLGKLPVTDHVLDELPLKTLLTDYIDERVNGLHEIDQGCKDSLQALFITVANYMEKFKTRK